MVLINTKFKPNKYQQFRCSPGTVHHQCGSCRLGYWSAGHQEPQLRHFLDRIQRGWCTEVEDRAGDIGQARLHVTDRQPRRLGP